MEGAAKRLHLPRLHALQATPAGGGVEGDFVQGPPVPKREFGNLRAFQTDYSPLSYNASKIEIEPCGNKENKDNQYDGRPRGFLLDIRVGRLGELRILGK